MGCQRATPRDARHRSAAWDTFLQVLSHRAPKVGDHHPNQLEQALNFSSIRPGSVLQDARHLLYKPLAIAMQSLPYGQKEGFSLSSPQSPWGSMLTLVPKPTHVITHLTCSSSWKSCRHQGSSGLEQGGSTPPSQASPLGPARMG